MFDQLLIRSMQLEAGRTPGMPPQQVQLCNLTVFVGPNNSGKSLALSEIAQWSKPEDRGTTFVVAQPEFSSLTAEQAALIVKLFQASPNDNEVIPLGNVVIGSRNAGHFNVRRGQVEQTLLNPKSSPSFFRQFYVNNVTTNLAVENRANITGAKAFGDLLKPDPFNSYQVLFLNDGLRKDVQEILRRAFQRVFILDPSSGANLRILFATRPPSSPQAEQGFHKESRDYYASAESIDKFSAGVKAYTGTIVEVVAGNSRVVIIDEPEAFLYPPLAQQLGKELATLAVRTRKNVFVATHSADFVMGCLHAGASADIIRLTYQNGTATARVLKNTELTRMMRNPLLRSAGVIDALFYESVVVTESDADRAFYQEVNQRLLSQGNGRGIPNCLFLNAQNKQTTKSIVKPLRELGIATASIVDIDIFKEGGAVWSGHLESGFMPDLEMSSLAVFRSSLKAAIESSGKDVKRNGGVGALDSNDREGADNLFDRLDSYGLFTVRGGELECWLKHLGATNHGPDWLIKMFEKMGEDPSDPNYVHAGNGDVWAFMDRVASWLQNPNRKGMPD